jgi:hypothetical protein
MREPNRVRDADEAFDIFKATVNGPLWVEAVQGLKEAKERMPRLALTSPGEYPELPADIYVSPVGLASQRRPPIRLQRLSFSSPCLEA